jgi:hypothetical protein
MPSFLWCLVFGLAVALHAAPSAPAAVTDSITAIRMKGMAESQIGSQK